LKQPPDEGGFLLQLVPGMELVLELSDDAVDDLHRDAAVEDGVPIPLEVFSDRAVHPLQGR
jgi:hypothetical protein